MIWIYLFFFFEIFNHIIYFVYKEFLLIMEKLMQEWMFMNVYENKRKIFEL